MAKSKWRAAAMGERGYSVSRPSGRSPRPACRLLLACSIRRKNRGSFFGPLFKPILLWFETDQDSGRLAVAGDNDLPVSA
jgi:hypothetical protein